MTTPEKYYWRPPWNPHALTAEQLAPYEVTNDGHVYQRTEEGTRGRELRQTAHQGYRVVRIEGARYLVHRLVLLAHSGPPPDGKPFACHRDGNKGNNNSTNLYWGSFSDNAQDSWRHRRERKVAMAERKIPKEELPPFINTAALAKKLNVSEARIRQLATDGRVTGAHRYGRNWLFTPGARIIDAPQTTKRKQDAKNRGKRWDPRTQQYINR